MTPIIRYLKEGWLPKDKMEARRIQIRVAHFIIIDDVLYRRGYSLPYLRCASSEEVDYVFRVVHEGICGNHIRARSLARKALRARYYWPTYRKTYTTSSEHATSINALQMSNETRKDDDTHILTMALRPIRN